MDERPSNDIFEIRLTDEGFFYIRRFVKIVRIAIALSIVSSVAILISSTKNLLSFDPDLYDVSKWIKLQWKLYPYYLYIYVILVFIQVYYFWRFGKTMSKSLEHKNEKSFNESFRYLCINLSFAVLSVFLGLVFDILMLYNDFSK